MLNQWWQVLLSTLAAFIGVQTEQNRRKDFQASSPIPFIVMGILLAIVFVLGLLFIVSQVVG
ncbi:DUF2970 domain-containing protein [Shewanella sp. Choline-02u-19]|jgi:hypothetical protein|uniref:DUF2970 domain-containing protein n=1 Tax=unclassified Shewanella TaxID=196818 RepID=UPI000C31EC9A|nr:MULTISPECIES: DUF2970 domain-containing protein [unclassified Shewanella]PKG75592.1 DUF2970 domain-containing protein [Shewanella sp. GutCb]PKH53992.1 DUF2970 domain-containing protein [Shewanella sp. Bg11-22]PKI30505.1 DUF2970 domain-containing protein [Shewanella sp. Choline-02u-19]